MGKYNGAVITNAGEQLLASAIAGTELRWTVMRTSTTVVSTASIKAMTSLTGVQQTANITRASVYSDNVVQVSARFPNTDIAAAYQINTVGIYGRLWTDTQDTLIAVMTAVTADTMPVYDADSPAAYIFTNHLTVQDAASVTMSVNDTGTATVADLEGKLDVNGDASEVYVSTFTTSSASYPVPQTGDSFKQILGKICKFFADIKAAVVGLTISGRTITWTKADGTTGTLTTQDTTYSNATASAAGLMSTADKIKLNGIASGAQVNSITGVKGNAESTYRTGQVNITPANVGAAPTSHASVETTFGLGNQSAYGHVKLVDNLDSSVYAAGEALSAHAGYLLSRKVDTAVADTVISRTWAFGGSFQSAESPSYATVWQSGKVVVVTFAASASAAIPARADRNIITNLPAAANRVYLPATVVQFDSSGPQTVVGQVICSMRPDQSATVLKVDGNINPTDFQYGTIYGTFAYITSE